MRSIYISIISLFFFMWLVPSSTIADQQYLMLASFTDKDNDGIKNKDDLCPREAEDIDNFHDNDGCPDYDNDKDGIPDKLDRCPNRAEDIDGFEDNDGCPDPDNDKDGIPDIRDKCPNQPEDQDGYKDSDGCSDLDNDKDGIIDSLDQCRNTAEDIDGFEDQDGCPDVDNDKDGIPDSRDKCPDQRENINNIADDDGCPDENIPQIPMGKILFDEMRFVGHSTEIAPQSYETLDKLAKKMIVYPETELNIIAHTDKTSDPQADYDVSVEMAKTICSYLIRKGVNEQQLNPSGMGSSKPIASNVTPQGREKNRRIEIERIK